MNTPNAVKVFMWRAYHNALATKANLFQWNITEDPLCPTYGVEVETMGHVLWSFPATKYIWSRCGSKIQKRSIKNAEFVFILEELLQYLGKEDIELMAVVWLECFGFVGIPKFMRRRLVHHPM
jgi:hypothetical protein